MDWRRTREGRAPRDLSLPTRSFARPDRGSMAGADLGDVGEPHGIFGRRRGSPAAPRRRSRVAEMAALRAPMRVCGQELCADPGNRSSGTAREAARGAEPPGHNGPRPKIDQSRTWGAKLRRSAETTTRSPDSCCAGSSTKKPSSCSRGNATAARISYRSTTRRWFLTSTTSVTGRRRTPRLKTGFPIASSHPSARLWARFVRARFRPGQLEAQSLRSLPSRWSGRCDSVA